jgi:hypothetical protein
MTKHVDKNALHEQHDAKRETPHSYASIEPEASATATFQRTHPGGNTARRLLEEYI